jgi:predicted CoA-substrate-specific enzyme activase
MNQKCGSGTGLFLDVVADALEVDIEAIGEMSLESTKRINMNSACAVFAESEVISLIHQGEKRSDILSAVFHMIAAKTAALAQAARMEKDIVFGGGVAKNAGMVKAMSDVLGTKILVPAKPDLLNALGAALEAKEML